MMTNKEIRVESWQLLWREGWLWRVMAAGATLGAILGLVVWLTAALYAYFGVESLAAFQKAKLSAARAGLGYAAPTQEATVRMYAASLFKTFLQHLFSCLVMAGVTAVMMRAVRRDAAGWFRDAFIGFRMPLTMFWLWFCEQFLTGMWILGTLLPCLVVAGVFQSVLGLPVSVTAVLASIPAAFVMLWVVYRYRLCWYVKIDNPDLSARRCLRGSICLMQGQKMRAVSLDCSFWPWFLLLVPFLSNVAYVGHRVVGDGLAHLSASLLAGGALSLLLTVVLVAVIGWWMALAHAIFYRELLVESPR